jgi:hypothetical protein
MLFSGTLSKAGGAANVDQTKQKIFSNRLSRCSGFKCRLRALSSCFALRPFAGSACRGSRESHAVVASSPLGRNRSSNHSINQSYQFNKTMFPPAARASTPAGGGGLRRLGDDPGRRHRNEKVLPAETRRPSFLSYDNRLDNISLAGRRAGRTPHSSRGLPSWRTGRAGALLLANSGITLPHQGRRSGAAREPRPDMTDDRLQTKPAGAVWGRRASSNRLCRG